MFPQKAKTNAEVDPKTYPLGGQIEHGSDGTSLALVALSHTPIERRLYAAMLSAANGSANQPDAAANPLPRARSWISPVLSALAPSGADSRAWSRSSASTAK